MVYSMSAGESLTIHTPGGGGYGAMANGFTSHADAKWLPPAGGQPMAYARANGSLADYAATQETRD